MQLIDRMDSLVISENSEQYPPWQIRLRTCRAHDMAQALGDIDNRRIRIRALEAQVDKYVIPGVEESDGNVTGWPGGHTWQDVQMNMLHRFCVLTFTRFYGHPIGYT